MEGISNDWNVKKTRYGEWLNGWMKYYLYVRLSFQLIPGLEGNTNFLYLRITKFRNT